MNNNRPAGGKLSKLIFKILNTNLFNFSADRPIKSVGRVLRQGDFVEDALDVGDGDAVIGHRHSLGAALLHT